MINFENSIFGNHGTIINTICTLVFLIAWLIYGFKSGIDNRENYILYTLGYLVINIVATIIYESTNISFIGIFPVFISLLPMYGLYGVIKHVTLNETVRECILISLIGVFSIVGYISGLIVDKVKYEAQQ